MPVGSADAGPRRGLARGREAQRSDGWGGVRHASELDTAVKLNATKVAKGRLRSLEARSVHGADDTRQIDSLSNYHRTKYFGSMCRRENDRTRTRQVCSLSPFVARSTPFLGPRTATPTRSGASAGSAWNTSRLAAS